MGGTNGNSGKKNGIDRYHHKHDVSFSSLTLEELYKSLATTPHGLSSEEARWRLEKYGPNTLPEKKVGIAKKILIQLLNLFNVLLLFSAALALVSGIIYNDKSSFQMAAAIIAVTVFNVAFSLVQEWRAERAVEALKKLIPERVIAVRNEKLETIQPSQVVPGDLIMLEAGDKVPADARLTSAVGLFIDNSTMTGESVPVPRYANPAPNEHFDNILENPHMVMAGTTISSGSATAIIFATGASTELGLIVTETSSAEEPLSPLQKEIDFTAKVDFVVSIIIGFVFFAVALLVMHLSVLQGMLFMIGVMLSLVPEGLQLTVTLALAISSLAMARRNVVVKRLSAVETLGSVTVMCVDKTGTITKGQMTARKAWLADGKMFEISGDGYGPEGAITLNGVKANVPEHPGLLKLSEGAALNNKARLNSPPEKKSGRWTAIGDSTDAAVLVLSIKAGTNAAAELERRPRAGSIPLDSIRKMMTSVHREADGTFTAYTKGAADEVLPRCNKVFMDGKATELDEKTRESIVKQVDLFSGEAYRVLAFAERIIQSVAVVPEDCKSEVVEKELTFIGLVAILDPPRPEVVDAVKKARTAGIRIIMLTGDHELTAEAIARNVGIATSGNNIVLTGRQMRILSDEELSKILKNDEVVFARITPDQKFRVVRLLRSKGEIVAVTGDGVNDAPALMEAEIGISMGIDGTDVARESSDMVLLDDNFASIVNGIEIGRSIFDNLKKFVLYVFSHNWAELTTFIAFILLRTPLPLTVLQVLAIDLLMDVPPSLALTLEPPEPHVMRRHPSKKGRFFDTGVLLRSMFIGGLIGVWALTLAFQTWVNEGWWFGKQTIDPLLYAKGTTIVMAGIMAGQLGNLFASRTNIESLFTFNLKKSKWLIVGALASTGILAMFIYVPFFQAILGTAPLSLSEWFYLYSIVPVILLTEEIRKQLAKRKLLGKKPKHPPAPTTITASAAV